MGQAGAAMGEDEWNGREEATAAASEGGHAIYLPVVGEKFIQTSS